MDAPFVLLADPQIAAMPVRDCHEPLVDLRTRGVRLDARKQDPRGAYAHLRSGALARLLTAQERCPDGLRLLVVEGYRPPVLQRRYFDEYAGTLRAAHPGWDAATVHREASKYVAPVDVAPHATGGAVDLTLCTLDGLELDMGTAVNASPEESANACYTAAGGIGDAAAANRGILVQAMTSAGFVNYPTEWWHWSYGDRYWAYVSGSQEARYGATRW